MPSSNRQVNLPPERLSQLRRIAVAASVSVSTALEGLISSAAAAGTIPDAFDSFTAQRRGDHVVLTLVGHELTPMTVPAARGLASLLQGFVTRTISGTSCTHTDGAEIIVRRAGRGFSIASAGRRIIVTRTMAGDVIRQLRKAAA